MSEPACFVRTFVNDLNTALWKLKPNAKLTHLQQVLLDGDTADAVGVLGKVRTNKFGWL